MPIDMVLEDHRENSCRLCRKPCNPTLRFCYGFYNDDVGLIADCEMEVCTECANKHCPGWKRYLQ